MMNLTAADAALLKAEAARCGLAKSTWAAALVERRLRGVPRFHQSEELSLISIHRELRHIALLLGDILELLNRIDPTPDALLAVSAAVELFRHDARAQVEAVGQIAKGNLDYWEVRQ